MCSARARKQRREGENFGSGAAYIYYPIFYGLKKNLAKTPAQFTIAIGQARTYMDER